MLSAIQAPSIRVRRKSRQSDGDEARVIAQALSHHRFDTNLLPVINPMDAHAKPLGWVMGRQFPDPRVLFLDNPTGEALHREIMRCAFVSVDDLLSEIGVGKKWDWQMSKSWSGNPVAGNFYDFFPGTGFPAAGAFTGAAFTAVQFSDATAGSLYHGGNVSTDQKSLLTAFPMATAGASSPTLYLYDRVLTYEACTFNASASQSMTNTLTAQRYNAGAPGLDCFIACQTATGATAANLTALTYVNQAGTAGQTMPTSPTSAFIASLAAPATLNAARIGCPTVSSGTAPFSKFILKAAGDTGMRSITNYTTSAANTGTLTFVLCRELACIPIPMPIGTYGALDFVQGLPNLPVVLDGACLSFLAFAPVATASNFFASGSFGWG